MKKRLRKKLHRGEFQELGFEVRVRFDADLSEEAWFAFWDRMVDFVEARGLTFGGGGTLPNGGAFVDRPGRASATEEDRAALREWLQEQPEVEEAVLGDLVDAYHGPLTL